MISGSFEPLSVTPSSSSSAAFANDKFRIIEGDDLKPYLDAMDAKEGKAPAGIPDDEPLMSGAGGGEGIGTSPDVPAGGGSDAATGGSGSMETD